MLRGIAGSMNRFLSILFIVALGAGFLAGLFATSPDMYESADRYMDEYDWYDLDIKSTLGFTAADVEAVAALSTVEKCQPARTLDVVLSDSEETGFTSRVFALTDDAVSMNKIELLSGRMPETDTECVVQSAMGPYADNAPKIGETLTVAGDNLNYDTILENTLSDTLTVVGLAQSPMCISVEADVTSVGSGSVGLLVYTRNGYLTSEVYTDLYLTVRGAKEVNTFGEEYDALTDAALREIDALTDERAALRTAEVRAQAEDTLADAEGLLSSLNTIADARTKLAKDAMTRIGQTSEMAAILGDSSVSKALTDTALSVRASVMRQMTTASAEKQRLTDLEKTVSDGRKTIDETEDCVWVSRTRDDSAGYASYDGNVEKVTALCKVFPVFFFLVALLVALTTMTRLVDENRTEIGTLKALGFSDGQVLAQYLLYSLLSSFLGCALGFFAGFQVLPAVISSAYGMMYFLPTTATPFRLEIAVLVAPVTVGGILLATLWACFGAFRSCPAQLMVPKAPTAGKRIWLEHLPFIWNHLSFTRKVTFRNLFRYRKRFLMTVIGVAGCSALLVTGFGVRDSIHDIVDRQFGEVYRYDLTMVTDKEDAPETDETLNAFLNDKTTTEDWLAYAGESGKALANDESQTITLMAVTDASRLPAFIALRERKSGKALTLTDDGILLTEKSGEMLGVSAGDTVTLENADGRRAEVTVLGLTENYITGFAYMTDNLYQKLYGKVPAHTAVMCRLVSGREEGAAVGALKSSHVLYVRSSASIRSAFSDTVRSIDAIVVVLILCAGMLCMVVLYNLTNVNICERRKELATIKVLGFHEREVEQYIFRETDLLSVLGTIAGLFVGIWLHGFVIRTVEVSAVMFGREIKGMSFAYAFAISMIFTALINLVMRRSIRRVDMVESMKAND